MKPSKKKTKKQEEVEFTMSEKLFTYYLDAWNYCRKHDINIKRIKKVNFKTWEISDK